MPIRSSDAVWQGSVTEGQGTVALGSGAFQGQYSFTSRFENGTGTNPEELVAAAHAACFSMALSADLGAAGHEPSSIKTTANVHINKTDSGWAIPTIDLRTEATVPGIDQAELERVAEQTKKNCPISVLLGAAEINLDIKLAG